MNECDFNMFVGRKRKKDTEKGKIEAISGCIECAIKLDVDEFGAHHTARCHKAQHLQTNDAMYCSKNIETQQEV